MKSNIYKFIHHSGIRFQHLRFKFRDFTFNFKFVFISSGVTKMSTVWFQSIEFVLHVTLWTMLECLLLLTNIIYILYIGIMFIHLWIAEYMLLSFGESIYFCIPLNIFDLCHPRWYLALYNRRIWLWKIKYKFLSEYFLTELNFAYIPALRMHSKGRFYC